MRLRYAALSDVGRVRRDNQDSGYAGPHLLVDRRRRRRRRPAATSPAARPSRCSASSTTPGRATTCSSALAGAIHRSHDRIAELVEENPEIEGTSTTVTRRALRRHPARRRPRRRQPRLPAARRHPVPADHRPHLRAEPDRRGPDHRGRGPGPPAPQPDPARGRRGARARARRVHPRGGRRRPAPALLRRLLGRARRRRRSPALLGEGTPDHAAVPLVSAALDAGSSDNVTVVVADVVDDDAVDDAETSAAAAPARCWSAPRPRRRAGEADRRSRPRGRRHRRARAGRPRGADGRRRPRGDPLRTPAARAASPGPAGSPSLVVVARAASASIGDRRLQVDPEPVLRRQRRRAVAIYQGVEADLPGISMHHVEEPAT